MSDPLLNALVRFTRLAAQDSKFTSLAWRDTKESDRPGYQENAEQLDAFVDELVEEKGVALVLAALLEWMCDTYEESSGKVQ